MLHLSFSGFFYLLALNNLAILRAAPVPPSGTTPTVCFSPGGDCDQRLIEFIRSARQSLDIAVFDLTHPQIAHEILVASRRIPVRVVVDHRQAKHRYSMVSTLVRGKLNIRYGVQRGIMHNKFVIVDGTALETGSYNFTEGATYKNNENQLYLTNPETVQKYRKQFEKIWMEGRLITDQQVAGKLR